MAVRAQQWGMRVMINFHYSDSWADPGKQKKPAAWEGHPFLQLLQDVYSYAYDVMNYLKKAGVQPEWVQVGNETPRRMIYPEGSTAHWPQLATLINKGYDAIKAISPRSKVVLHLDRGTIISDLKPDFTVLRHMVPNMMLLGFPLIPGGWKGGHITLSPLMTWLIM